MTQDKLSPEQDSQGPLSFPCQFPIKVFGMASDDFELNVLTIIRKHVPDLTETALRQKASKNGKYMAMTITLEIKTRAQLDAIYQDLTQSPFVLMAL